MPAVHRSRQVFFAEEFDSRMTGHGGARASKLVKIMKIMKVVRMVRLLRTAKVQT